MGQSGRLNRLELTLRIQNLTNQKYEEVLGFPAPGINALAGLRAYLEVNSFGLARSRAYHRAIAAMRGDCCLYAPTMPRTITDHLTEALREALGGAGLAGPAGGLLGAAARAAPRRLRDERRDDARARGAPGRRGGSPRPSSRTSRRRPPWTGSRSPGRASSTCSSRRAWCADIAPRRAARPATATGRPMRARGDAISSSSSPPTRPGRW